MVWFYPTKGESPIVLLKSDFQSHYGLILSSALSGSLQGIFSSFNPTMVWFYLYRREFVWLCSPTGTLSIPLWSDFIQYLLLQRLFLQVTFNPTMVWFYLLGYLYEFSTTFPFQSHYGLILSKARREHTARHRSHFQSHYGLILSVRNIGGLIFVSLTFNPTMVWFYRSFWESEK